jgi:6-phosphofructo-2-kinase/fructose-2,6-biphosphatase 4
MNSSGAATPQVSSGGMSVKVKVIEKTQMSEINPGVWDGLTPDQARKYYPDEWDRFCKDPYAFRAPRAESYHDLSGKLQMLFPYTLKTDLYCYQFAWNQFLSS